MGLMVTMNIFYKVPILVKVKLIHPKHYRCIRRTAVIIQEELVKRIQFMQGQKHFENNLIDCFLYQSLEKGAEEECEGH